MIFIWNIIKYYLIVGIIILLVLKIDKLKRKLSLILDDTERYIPLLITIIYVAIEFKIYLDYRLSLPNLHSVLAVNAVTSHIQKMVRE